MTLTREQRVLRREWYNWFLSDGYSASLAKIKAEAVAVGNWIYAERVTPQGIQ